LASDRPWHGAWPAHLPHSLDYPRVPAWWLLERNLPRFADRVALRELDHETLTERRTLTYEALWRAVRGAASGLRAVGVGPGVRVGFSLANSVELIVGFYATWYAGGVVVPTNPQALAEEQAQQLGDAGVSFVIGAASGAGGAAVSASQVAAEKLEVPFVDVAAFRAMESETPGEPAACAPDDDVAVLLYTGGTTGLPKGAMLTHRNIAANTTQFAEWYAFAPGDETSVCAIPMYHSGGMAGVMNVPLARGATLLVFAKFSPRAVAQSVARYRVTRLFGVPTMFIALLNDEAGRAADYSTLRACRTNAAPLPPTVKASFDALVGRPVLVEGYGLTETSPLTHANPIARAKAGSIGVPLPDTDARIVGLETGADVEPGESGELLIRGPQVMRGYWNRPEATAQVLRDGWLSTGDVAVMDDEGYFAIVDRKKDMINTSGFKVWPREVEETLYRHPAVKLAAVIGVADAYRGEAVKACVVLKDGQQLDEVALAEFCRKHLTAYKVPRVIEFRDALPTSGAGKLLRRLLREQAAP
jgi:long-chain acyl-CoA synthetase